MQNGIIAACLALVGLAGDAAAQEIPDLKGSWVETGERGGLVRRGQRFEHPPTTDDKVVFGDLLTWTLTVERQEGVVFSGTWASENRIDPMVGAISANGRSVYLADDNGPMHGELRGPDQMEICRSCADAERMRASCWNFARRR